MNPSKENCVEALNRVGALRRQLVTDDYLSADAPLSLVEEFLRAVQKRLPSEAAIAKDKLRKKQKA